MLPETMGEVSPSLILMTMVIKTSSCELKELAMGSAAIPAEATLALYRNDAGMFTDVTDESGLDISSLRNGSGGG
ncbi:MAG: hypothetical protein R3C05_15720 [Pirellulaceae bacterium]